VVGLADGVRRRRRRVAVLIDIEVHLGLVEAQRPVGEAAAPHRPRRAVQQPDV